jgi:uncharacterized protein (TIGR02147 family)
MESRPADTTSYHSLTPNFCLNSNLGMTKKLSEALKLELKRRQLLNPRYSMRSFARALELEPSQLSKILREKIEPTIPLIERILLRLEMPDSERENILNSVKSQRLEKKNKYRNSKLHFVKSSEGQNTRLRNAIDFTVFVALGLDGVEKSALGLHAVVGFAHGEIEESLQAMSACGLIEKTPDGYKKLQPQYSDDPFDPTSGGKLQTQKAFLDFAIQALQQVPVEHRLNGTLTMTMDQKLIERVKRKIDVFLRELNGWVAAESRTTDSLYSFTVALYPMTRKWK